MSQGAGGGGEKPPDTWNVEVKPPPGTVAPPFAGRIQERQDRVRGAMAVGFAALFALTIVWACVCWNIGVDPRELLQLLLPAETALLGSVIGFYFGTKNG